MDNCCRFAFYDCAQIRIQVETCENLQKHAVVRLACEDTSKNFYSNG